MEITRVSHPSYAHIACPYCGAKNMVHISAITNNKIVTLCDTLDVPGATGDGCDEYFAIDIRIKYETTVYKLTQASS